MLPGIVEKTAQDRDFMPKSTWGRTAYVYITNKFCGHLLIRDTFLFYVVMSIILQRTSLVK